MIIWNSGGDIVQLGYHETKYCETCEKTSSFNVILEYRYWGLYWLFNFVTSMKYLLVCEVCQRGVRLEKTEVKQKHKTASIPFMHKYGFLILASLISIFVLSGVFETEESSISSMNYGNSMAYEPFLGFGEHKELAYSPNLFPKLQYAILYCETKQNDEISLSIITVNEYSVGEEILSRLNEGESFGKLASQLSNHTSRTADGYIGKFTISDLNAEFQHALDGLAEGSYTEIIKLSGQ